MYEDKSIDTDRKLVVYHKGGEVRFRTISVVEFDEDYNMDYIIGYITLATVPTTKKAKVKMGRGFTEIEGGKNYLCSFTFCEPNDLDKFSRPWGKMETLRRLVFPENTYERPIIVNIPEGKKMLDILKVKMIEVAKKKKITWMRKLTIENLV